MLRKINHPDVPKQLHGSILVDKLNLPRYWVTIYSIFHLNTLAESTKNKKLRLIDTFYEYSEQYFGYGKLDQILASIDVDSICQLCEAYFLHIQNNNTSPEISEIKWQTALDFLLNTLRMISRANFNKEKFEDITAKFNRIERLYSSLRIHKPKRIENIRSLPNNLIDYLYAVLDPYNLNNPFHQARSKWQTYIIFLILINLGLRRGELLILPVNAIKHNFDNKLNKIRYWINIENSHKDEDYRYSQPNIKTTASYRQIPISESLVNLIEYYIREHRGKVDHPFLLTSQKDKPLSVEMVNRIFNKISTYIPKDLQEELFNCTYKKNISPHDLRHTCAVLRLQQLLQNGDSMDEALAKLRLFFGWVRDSNMPLRYARAVFEERLSTIWDDELSQHTNILKNITKVKGNI